MEKRCTRCGIVKAVDEFSRNKTKKDGRQVWCRSCFSAHVDKTGSARAYARELKQRDPDRIRIHQRRTRLKNRYGLTEADFERMVEAQEGKCRVCQRVPDYRLFVDHDHATGQVRGLLCSKCNGALGWLENNRHRISSYLGLDPRWLSPEGSTPRSSRS